MIFRNHKVCTKNPHCYWVRHYSLAFQLTRLGNIFSQDELHDKFTQTLSFKFMTTEFLLNFIDFTSGFSFSHTLNLSSQRYQHNYSFALSYNRQRPQNNIITTTHDRPE